MASPLFTLAAATVRRAATEQFRKSTYGKLLSEVGSVARLPQRVQPQAVGRLLDKYKRGLEPRQIVKEITGLNFGQFVRQIERYAKGDAGQREMVTRLIRELGPAGNLIKSLVGSGAIGKGSLQRELDAATRLLEAFGHVVVPPQGSPTVGQMKSGTEGLIDYLETQGYQVAKRIPEPPEKTLPFGIPVTTARGDPRQVIDVPSFGGKTVRVRVDDAMVTGDFVHVSSSNVHSIAYDLENALLYVRFLAPAGKDEMRTMPGSLYQYHGITPEQFRNLQQVKSKGKWVWDHLRIRGTVSGHQVRWGLVGIMNGYVPRQATYMGNGQEWFIKRKLYMGRGQWAESELSDAPAGTPVNRGRANNGSPRPPNTGKPRR